MSRLGEREREMTDDSVLSELRTQIIDKESLHPKRYHDLNSRQKGKIYSSSFLTGPKYDASGELLKVKSRLVGGGHQHSELWDDESRSSPTAQTASVLIVAAMAAREGRRVSTFDFTAAYLNAKMGVDADGDEVIMCLDEYVTKYVLRLKPEWTKFVTPKGRMFVQVDKAIYGFPPCSKLWYDELTKTLKEYGFTPNPEEPCVWNAEKDGHKITIALHVDDMMVTATAQRIIDDLATFLRSKYDGLTVHTGKTLDFVGMVFDWSVSGQVAVTTPGLEKSLLLKVTGTTPSPAEDNLFKIDTTAEALKEHDSHLFHSNVAALLYMGKGQDPTYCSQYRS
jgi:hypothetical protein